MTKNEWTTAGFDEMSWHDAPFYGFKLIEIDAETCAVDMAFDIDFTLHGFRSDDGAFGFVVAHGSLCFCTVSGLRFDLDYTAPPAGMCPFSIAGIERKPLTFPTGYQSFDRVIDINWPRGRIAFESPGFIQTLVGPVHEQDSQSLDARLRL